MASPAAIRVPVEVYLRTATLRRRAKRRGQSLSDYLRLQVAAWARQDTLDEALEGLQGLPQVDLIEAPAVTIRRDRDQERR